MEVYLSEQALKLVFALITGIKIAIIYHAFSLFSKIIPHGNVMIFIEDFIFGFIAVSSVFSYLTKYNSGQIRAYLIFGVIVGFILFCVTLGRFTNPLAKILKRILSIILYPFTLVFKLIFKFLKKILFFLKKDFIFLIKHCIIIKDYCTKQKEGGKKGGKNQIKKVKSVYKHNTCCRNRLPLLRLHKSRCKNQKR